MHFQVHIGSLYIQVCFIIYSLWIVLVRLSLINGVPSTNHLESSSLQWLKHSDICWQSSCLGEPIPHQYVQSLHFYLLIVNSRLFIINCNDNVLKTKLVKSMKNSPPQRVSSKDMHVLVAFSALIQGTRERICPDGKRGCWSKWTLAAVTWVETSWVRLFKRSLF